MTDRAPDTEKAEDHECGFSEEDIYAAQGSVQAQELDDDD